MRDRWAAVVGLLLGLLAIGPGLAPGFVLSYDMVFVPDPSFSRTMFGLTGTLPRAVPSDAFVTALSQVVPGSVVQKVLLLLIFVMACTSAASLVPSERPLARIVGGVCYAWNPYVAERLLLGHWALLLGYAALPWAVRAAARGDTKRLVRTLVPAAIGGFAALTVSAITLLPVAGGRGVKTVLRAVLVIVVLSLPWAIPALLRPAALPGAMAAGGTFAARADTPFGSLGSLLLLGGVWNREVVPSGYGDPVTVLPWLVVVVIALVAYLRWGRVKGLGVAAVLGVVAATLPSWLLGDAFGAWPPLAVFRDGQQYMAPLAVVIAVGLGTAVDRVLTRPDRAGVALAVFAIVAPLALLPGLAWGGSGRLRAVDYPADWAAIRRQVHGDVLVLPWAAYRSYSWNHGRTVFDPMAKYLPGRVIVNDELRVGRTSIAAEDPRARALGPAIRSGGPLTADLAEAGVSYVVVDTPDSFDARLAGAERVGPNVYRIPQARQVAERNVPVIPVALGWITTIGMIVWSIVLTRSTLVPRSPSAPGKEARCASPSSRSSEE